MPASESSTVLAAACCAGDLRALSRLISLLESNDSAQSAAAFDAVARFDYPQHVIGITGPPGAGKSTLVAYLAELALQPPGKKVAILAIDPSSPFTGGALLGDRIRMGELRNDPRVFIRSMGSRGASGGVAAAAGGALRALGAAGFDLVFLETVGAGQAETKIANLAHTVCVVQVPGLGDDVQFMKMGLLEAADVFAVNKSDKPEADDVKARLELAIAEHPDSVCRVLKQIFHTPHSPLPTAYSAWTPPVILVSATKRENGRALLDACLAHRAWLDQPGLRDALARYRAGREILTRAEALLRSRHAQELAAGKLEALTESFLAGTVSLGDAAHVVLATVGNSTP
ncbi:MAG TPA: methylmalonyl Co-A mutase-associated GTPase MeaB [Planctomycetota bacterium]|nr:methylmalonyl Co-A mutase-associated GTPase MeaB [Planctomycetota bacterium]